MNDICEEIIEFDFSQLKTGQNRENWAKIDHLATPRTTQVSAVFVKSTKFDVSPDREKIADNDVYLLANFWFTI